MPLTILLPMVIVGIAGIVLLLHVFGLSRAARLENEASARAAWLREFPDEVPERVIICRSGSAALVQLTAGFGVVWPMGADTTARHLTGARVSRTGGGVAIDLPDYTAPRIHLALDPQETADWSRLIEGST
ncbi:hypothetical protein AAFO92_20375 [Roseovarius sp. CAU 1744]|uniref:hypothetical protein n=1 Tax=Roseovarius sp. CAU 1744 TaxID=3140368 RepID=UPI00325A554F